MCSYFDRIRLLPTTLARAVFALQLELPRAVWEHFTEILLDAWETQKASPEDG